MSELGKIVYEIGEPKNITSEVLEEVLNLQNKVVISTACSTGSNNLAKPFVGNDNIYIAPEDDVDGSSSLLFVIRFFYEHLTLNKSIEESFNIARQNDKQTKLYQLFK